MAVLLMFGPARAAAGTERIELDGDTAGDVLAAAIARFGAAFGQVAAGSRLWVNGEPARESRAVGPADEVAVLPPVSGG